MQALYSVEDAVEDVLGEGSRTIIHLRSYCPEREGEGKESVELDRFPRLFFVHSPLAVQPDRRMDGLVSNVPAAPQLVRVCS